MNSVNNWVRFSDIDLGALLAFHRSHPDPMTMALFCAEHPEICGIADLRRDTCATRFDNLLNFGGFPDIPGWSPFGGTGRI